MTLKQTFTAACAAILLLASSSEAQVSVNFIQYETEGSYAGSFFIAIEDTTIQEETQHYAHPRSSEQMNKLLAFFFDYEGAPGSDALARFIESFDKVVLENSNALFNKANSKFLTIKEREAKPTQEEIEYFSEVENLLQDYFDLVQNLNGYTQIKIGNSDSEELFQSIQSPDQITTNKTSVSEFKEYLTAKQNN